MFNQVRHGCRRVHSGSLGTIEFALGVVGFILGHCVHALCALGFVGFIQGRWVHAGAPWGASGSFGIVGFTRVHPGGRQVYSECLGSRGCAMGGVGFIRDRWVHSGAPWGSLDSFRVFGFTRVRHGVCRVHSGS